MTGPRCCARCERPVGPGYCALGGQVSAEVIGSRRTLAIVRRSAPSVASEKADPIFEKSARTKQRNGMVVVLMPAAGTAVKDLRYIQALVTKAEHHALGGRRIDAPVNRQCKGIVKLAAKVRGGPEIATAPCPEPLHSNCRASSCAVTSTGRTVTAPEGLESGPVSTGRAPPASETVIVHGASARPNAK